MKALIFSDSHGYTRAMQKAWQMHRADTDAIFFLGDGYRDLAVLDLPLSFPVFAVCGNNDFHCPYPTHRMVEFGGKQIFLCHGHTFYVKSTTSHLIAQGVQRGADAVLFGHTHRAQGEYLNEDKTKSKPLHLFGCGSIGLPIDGKPAYATLQIYQNQIALTHAVVTHL